MFKIGEFSKLVQVPVPTLRYYDQGGLLKPVEVDSFTGYRYYSASQLPRLNRILALKELGFELAQIGVVLTEGLTPEQMRGMLRLRHAQIRQQEVSPLYAEVDAALEEYASSAGQPLVIWYDEEYKDQDIDGAAAVALRHRIPESGRVCIHELPSAIMATTIYQGGGTTRIEAQEALLTWIEANGYRIVGPSREVYLQARFPIRYDDISSVTEMQFPVEKAVPSHDLLHNKQQR